MVAKGQFTQQPAISSNINSIVQLNKEDVVKFTSDFKIIYSECNITVVKII